MEFHGTTVIAVKRGAQTAMAADGQVTLGNTIMKGNARKVRKIYDGKVMVGFAGATADADRFEKHLKGTGGDITRAAVELAKEWRTERALAKLEAMLLVADKEKILLISGNGDVVDPEEGIAAIGSGGMFAYAAALAYAEASDWSAAEIAEKSLAVAGRICIYTNRHLTLEVLE